MHLIRAEAAGTLGGRGGRVGLLGSHAGAQRSEPRVRVVRGRGGAQRHYARGHKCNLNTTTYTCVATRRSRQSSIHGDSSRVPLRDDARCDGNVHHLIPFGCTGRDATPLRSKPRAGIGAFGSVG